MKVFKFNPTTGKRGEHIEDRRIASWAGQGVNWLVEKGDVIEALDFVEPNGFGGNAEVTVHIDAGIGVGEDEISYRHPTDWICFCLGEMICGTDTYWDWVVLPPSNQVKAINDNS